MADVRRYQIWVDSDGQNVLTYVTGNGALLPVMTQLENASNASRLNAVENLLVVNATPTPNTAVFHSGKDQAILVYLCADGTLARLTLPAPQAALFMSDDETINPAAISLITTTAVGLVVSATGSPAVSFVSGIRMRKSQPLLK